MAQQYKFKNPSDATELDPKQGQVATTDTAAVVDYHFNSWTSSFDEWVETSVELSIDCQDFRVADLDDLISFLQTARAKLAEQNNGQK